MKKINLATFKSFLKKNEGNVFFKQETDVISDEGSFQIDGKETETSLEKVYDQNILTYSGNYFSEIENGFNVYNCCGSWNFYTK